VDVELQGVTPPHGSGPDTGGPAGPSQALWLAAPEDPGRRMLHRLNRAEDNFRAELAPAPSSLEAHPLSDLELASRLSSFLWSSAPDALGARRSRGPTPWAPAARHALAVCRASSAHARLTPR
jgi:hypothetical protein